MTILHEKIELCSHNHNNIAINIPGDKKVFKKLESTIWLFQYRFCSIVARIVWFGQLCPYTIKETISFADHDWTNNIFWSNGKYDGPSMKYEKKVSFYYIPIVLLLVNFDTPYGLPTKTQCSLSDNNDITVVILKLPTLKLVFQKKILASPMGLMNQAYLYKRWSKFQIDNCTVCLYT